MAIIFLILFLAGGLKGSLILSLLAMIFGILTIIASIVAPIFIMASYPAGVEVDEKNEWEEGKEDWENRVI